MRWGRTILLTVAMAGMMTIAVGRDAGAGQPDAGPFRVLVVNAQRKDVPNMTVEVRAPDQPRHSYTTGDKSTVSIPGDVAVEGAVVSAARGREALGWVQVGDQPQAGTGSRRAWMMLVPLTHRVEGSVVDRDGKLVAGARIGVEMLYHPTNRALNQDLRSQDPLLGFVVTDDAGKFTVTLPQDTRARLRALHTRSISPAIEVAANARTLGPATLEPTGGIAGRLTDAATGKPVAGAAVAAQLLERRQRHLTDGWGQAVTDDRGRFAIGELESGVYNVVLLEVPGREQAAARSVEAIRVRAGDDATADLSVIEGKPLRGVVIDRETNRPMAAAQVGCQGSALPRSGTAIMGTQTGAQGRFVFHVPPGEQFVYLIDDPSSRWMSRRVVVVPEQGEVMPIYLLRPRGADDFATTNAKPVPAPVGVTTETKAPIVKLRTVTGRVRDSQGRPLAGIRVAVDPGPDRPAPGVEPGAFDTAVTDRDGTFILAGLPRRKLPLILSRPRYESLIETIPADRDELVLTYHLHPDASTGNQAALVEDEPVSPATSRAIDVC